MVSVDPPGWTGWERLSGGGVAAVLFFPFLVPMMLSQYSDHAPSEVMSVGFGGEWLAVS